MAAGFRSRANRAGALLLPLPCRLVLMPPAFYRLMGVPKRLYLMLVINLIDSLAKFSFNMVWRRLMLAVLGLALVYVLVNVGLSWPWLEQPFAGFLHVNRV